MTMASPDLFGEAIRNSIIRMISRMAELEKERKEAKQNQEKEQEMTTQQPQAPQDRFLNAEVHIRRHGTQITLPDEPYPMKYEEAINCLNRKITEENEEVEVLELVDAFPFDGAHAFALAMKEIYGWASPTAKEVETMFGTKKIKPKSINVEVDFGQYVQVFWGSFAVPNVDGTLECGMTGKDGRPVFVIQGNVKKRSQPEVSRLADLTRKIAKEQSIYRGKALRLECGENGEVDLRSAPKFLDLSRVNPNELTFSDDTAAQVNTSLFTPIEYTDACREHKIPLKRGVLLEGPFGTGKTLTAFVTALKAKANGWTFIMVDRVTGLDQALKFARQFQPAVVFAEDVDRAISGQERSIEIDDILNTIDGIEAKGSEVITILTSNDVTAINRAMIRPGRLDAIISIQAPDAKAAEKLTRLYARGLIKDGEDLSGAGLELSGQIPAVIREAVERAKLYAIGRSKGQEITLTSPDIVHAARGMKTHLELLNGKREAPKNVHELMGEHLADLVEHSIKRNGLWETIQETKKIVENLQ